MIFLSDKPSKNRGKRTRKNIQGDWAAWDIRTFEKIETDTVRATGQKGIDLRAPFQPLYEGKEMTADDVFVLMYSKEKEKPDSIEDFRPEFSEPHPEHLEGDTKINGLSAKPSTPAEEKNTEKEPDFSGNQPEVEKKNPLPEIKIDTEEIKKEAYAEGFKKGETDGYKKGLEAAAGPVDDIKALVAGLNDLWNKMIRANEEKILKLIGLTVDKIVYGHVTLDTDVVKKSVLDAFCLLTEPESAVIYVNNEDYEHIDAVKDDFFKEITALKQVSIISDPSVSRGGCRIESESGEVDATLEARLETVKKCIIEASGKASGKI